MATYTLTGGADSFIGADTVADTFVIGTSDRLGSADTLRGGAGDAIDALRIAGTTAITIAAAAFAQVREMERLQIANLLPVHITLADAMVASTNLATFSVVGGNGNDTVLAGGVLATPLVMQGGGGDDMMEGGGGNDLLRPGLGADTMLGGAGAGADTIEMAFDELGTNDRLDGGAGSGDLLVLTGGGGAVTAARFAALTGIERIAMAAGSAGTLLVGVAAGYQTSGAPLTIVGAAGADTLSAALSGSAVLLDGLDGDDRLTGSNLADTLLGGIGNDVLRGMTGADLLAGGAGNDTFSGGAGNDTIEFGAGLDRADAGAGNDLYRVLVTDLSSSDLIADEAGAADALELGDVANVVEGVFASISISGALAGRLQGIERFLLGSGNDTVLATNAIGDAAGADVVTISGGAGNDRLDGSQVARLTTPLAFLLDGGDGADTLTGGRGADTLTAGAGNDLVAGGAGNDLFLLSTAAFDGADSLDGETGTDTLRLSGTEPVGPAAFAGVVGIEVIELDPRGQAVTLPGAFADGMGFTMSTIRGGAGDDLVDVSAFTTGRRVSVEFGAGDDTLFGGAGNDTVLAGAGVDEIQLGAGANRVTFAAGELSGLDTVTASTTGDFDMLVVGVAAGRTLAQGVFAGVSGFDVFNFDGGANSAVRLPGTLVSQSGQSTVDVNVIGASMVVDGRAVASAFWLNGGADGDTLIGGSGADTLVGSGGGDVHVGGLGGDRISLGSSTVEEDIALLRAQSDGTLDINTTRDIAGADSVSGTEFDGNFIKVDRFGFGLDDSITWFVGAAQNISLNYSAARLEGVSVAADDFGSLTAVRNAVGSRFVNNDAAVFEKLILVITGASNTRFGVYYFEDRDHNATVDSTDILRLLAIGTGAGPTFTGNSGFRLTSDFELL